MQKKNYLMGFLALALVASVLIPQASYSAEKGNQMPQARAGAHQSLEFFGVKVFRVSASATATHLVNGEGLLYGICAFAGTLGQYSLAYDTTHNTAQGEPAAVLDDNYSLAISPEVYVVNDTSTSGPQNKGCWEPLRPIKFLTGLYGKASNSGHQTQYYVGCTDGQNPCALTTAE